ncbi:CHAP domain-containing protein [Hymenobacter sp. H14-R3]|uniref:CHAP domain-containing protein n=1 Tax=Hymenobacter sp. H14-R3 TaxID=3046308 RepID=UPI0024BB6A13|nr:CHAP domain-containing protein [Hymenobacter sp. H14-R3]MDJ0363576.1 CHAP domain-containing protein [Hymenobacter sp. H14-R3]
MKAGESQVGVMEVGFNAGPQVERYQRSSGNRRGQPWCASFVTWCYKLVGLQVPRGSGLAASWFPAPKIIYRRGGIIRQPIKKGDTAGYAYGNGIHHIGLIQSWNDDFVITVEGNTGGGNGVQREGDGVHRMRRLRTQIALVSSWIPK